MTEQNLTEQSVTEQKITKVEAIPISIKYHIVPKSFYGSREFMNGVVVKIHTNQGLVGIGEGGAFIPPYAGETQSTALGVIRDVLGGAVLNENPVNIDKIVHKMDRLVIGNLQAKCVIDIALHDLAGKILKVPIGTLLGGKVRDRSPLGRVLGNLDPQGIAEDARRYVAAGFMSFDVKVAASEPDNDVRRIAALREAVGNDVEITVDANSGWTTDVAVHTIKRLMKYDIYGVEQPTPDIRGMAEVRQRTGIRIITDESVRNLSDMIRVIETKAADVVAIKLIRVGGLFKARQLVSIAEAAGMPVMMASTVGSGILSAAEAHFMTSQSWIDAWLSGHKAGGGVLALYGGLDTSELEGDIVTNHVRIKDAHVMPPEGNGLGTILDEDMLRQKTTSGLEPVTVQ